MRRGIVFLGLLAFGLAAPPPGGVSVSPSRVELTLAPGEERVVEFTVRGEGEFALKAVGFQMQGDRVVLTGEDCPHIRPQEAAVKVAGQRVAAVRVRAAERPGTAACLLQVYPIAEGSGVVLGVGIPVYVTRAGTEQIALSIGVLPDGRVVLENPGNTLLRLKGFVSYVEGGREVQRLPVEDYALLPGNTRVLNPPEGIGRGEALVYLEGQGKRWTKRGSYSR
jgi:hypothetical protein